MLVGDPVDTVAKTQTLIEREPVAFVAAFFVVAFAVSLWFLLRSKDRHLLAQEKAAKDHAKLIAELQRAHADKLDQLREIEHGRAIKLELMLHSLLEVTDDIRYLAFQSRERAARKRGADPKLPETGEHKIP